MTPDKVEAALGEAISAIRRAVDGLAYRGKGANATDEDNLRDEVYAELDPYVTEMEVELATLTEALAESRRDAARYRFIRESKSRGRADLCVCLVFWEQEPVQYMIRTEDRADAAIDAAMKDTDHDRRDPDGMDKAIREACQPDPEWSVSGPDMNEEGDK